MKYVKPFITCKNNAREMIKFYQEVFNAELVSIEEFKGVPTIEDGTVANAKLLVKNLELNLMDISEEYFVGYTHALSFLLECDNEEEFYNYFNQLKVEGGVIMGPEPIKMGIEQEIMWKLSTWVTDKYGVTWVLLSN